MADAHATMLHVIEHILAEERLTGSAADTDARAAFRICEKLRRSLSVLTGVTGFRSVLCRAVVLAKVRAAWLGELRIGADGALALSAELEARVGAEEAARGGVVLIESLLALLVTFIGEALTLRLVQDVWPKAAFKSPEHRKKDQP